MFKNEYFIKAMKAGLYKKKAWVVSAFATTNEGLETWKQKPYQYRLVSTSVGHFFVDIIEGAEPTLKTIEDSFPGQPLFQFLEPIDLKVGDVPNLVQDTSTTIGNTFWNMNCLVYVFGDRIPFITGEIDSNKIGQMMADRMQDTPPPGSDRLPGAVYADEFIRFVDATYHLTNYTQLCVWAATPKTMVAPPGIVEYRNKLIEENKDRLYDPAVIAKIEKALTDYDAAYLKGDPGENFLISGKSTKVVRKKLFLMHGGEAGIDEKVGMTLIQNSLGEGWDVSKFPIMNDSLRVGSFNRGAQTELGGESVKWLLRASSNITITVDDCGTAIGKIIDINQRNVGTLVGFNIFTKDGQKLVATTEEAGTYLGKTLMVRSPMYCILDKTDYCKACVGKRLADNPTGVSLAVSEYGSAFLNLFMKAMHGKVLALAKMDYQTALT